MKLGSYLITFMVGLAGASTFAKAEETKLIFTTLSPPTARIAKEWLEPWANRVNERGKGVVSLDIRHGLTLANFGNVYDRVQNDVVQISFALQTAIGGKFPATEVLTLPIWDDHEKAAVAFWKVYKAGGLGAEYDDIVPLFMSPTTQASLHFSKQPRTLDDLKGIKIMVASKLTGQMVSAAGGTPLSIPLGEVYEALQRGTVDGAALGWTSFEPFKLGEVTKFHANVRAGASANMVFMSKKRFNALSPEARKIL
ncbi:MAG: TRAP transporter substrate-binding protein DctP, partial [Acidobacteriaceae bacterium]|nr:TRAP transporter substrate-binding protein DctP [Acidobacteriaceae bacterium]